MKNKILPFLVLFLVFVPTACLHAQGWVKKIVRKNMVSLTTYDKDQQPLHYGSAFFITDTGVAISNYELFKDAYSAIVTDSKGKTYAVTRIMGADLAYSLVKFQTEMRKVTPLHLLNNTSIGTKVITPSYSNTSQKNYPTTTITDISTLSDGGLYYTLADTLTHNLIGSPLLNEDGLLVGIIQPSIEGYGYAVGSQIINELQIKAIGSKSITYALNNIHIAKALPDTMEEALVFLYMRSNTMNDDEYMLLINDFVNKYPENAEGYIRRARGNIEQQHYEEADSDLHLFIDKSNDKGVAYAEVADAIYSKLIYQPLPTFNTWTFSLVKDYIDKAIAVYPKKTDYKFLRANTLTALGEFENAIIELDSALALMLQPLPKQASRYVMRRAQLYEQVGRFRDAVKDYNTYIYLEEQKVTDEFYYNRAVLEFKSRMYQQCLDDLEKAIELNPQESLYKETQTKIKEALQI